LAWVLVAPRQSFTPAIGLLSLYPHTTIPINLWFDGSFKSRLGLVNHSEQPRSGHFVIGVDTHVHVGP
jgi:hypothetical protein